MFGRIRTELRELAGRFDPSLVDAATARRLLDDVIAIENIAAAVKASLATRVADTGLWRDGGDRTAAVELARRTGVSINDAHTTLETGRRLVSLPATSRQRAAVSCQRARPRRSRTPLPSIRTPSPTSWTRRGPYRCRSSAPSAHGPRLAWSTWRNAGGGSTRRVTYGAGSMPREPGICTTATTPSGLPR